MEVVNHASVVIRAGGVALLTDPWYAGSAFRGGWGLQWENPHALERIKDCTHLWVSHVHSDHFHAQTLRQVAAAAPGMTVLVNRSANLDMVRGLRAAGFTKLKSLPERRRVSIDNVVAVTRYPSTAIDSMLLVETPAARVLDLNDCNMPATAFRKLRRRMGHIDVLLANYNHAGKLYDYPSHDAVRREWSDRFVRTVEPFRPGWIVPFASAHYYRAEHTRHQNESLLTLDDVRRLDARALPVEVGCRVSIRPGARPLVERVADIRTAPRNMHAYSASANWDSLIGAARRFRARIGREFLGLVGWLRPVRFLATDHERVLVVDLRRGIAEAPTAAGHHVAAHSEALLDLFTKPNGADGFFVGGHFAFGHLARDAVQRLHLASSLQEGGIAPRQALGLLTRPSGWSFYWNRREEAQGVISGRRLRTWDRS